jgi:LysM repeat protein
MTHIVKRGDTLEKIAKSHGITLDQLLEANPQFRANPDIIHPGDVIIIPGEESAPFPPLTTPSAFAGRLALIARAQHDRFQLENEADPELCGQIRRWTREIGGTFVSCTSNAHPWSGALKRPEPPNRSSSSPSDTRSLCTRRFKML